jgi:uncharacterized protein YaiE (UPF0345 family)
MGIANITNNILTDSGLDTSSFLTTSAAASTYLPLAGGTLTGALGGTSANFTGAVTSQGLLTIGNISSANNSLIAFANTANFSPRYFYYKASDGSINFTNDSGIDQVSITDDGNLLITGGGLQVSGSASANRQVAELYTSGSVSRLAASYVGASSYGSLELLTSGLARLTIADTGGITLTGALNGTSAVFSSSVTPTGITNNGIYYGKANASFPATSLGYFALKTNNLDGERGGLTVQVSNATSTFIDALTINYTGAATFSSSVKSSVASGGSVITSESTATNGEGQFVILGKNSSGTVRSASFKYDNADILRIGTSSAIDFRFETNDTERMRITSGGNVEISTGSIKTGNPSGSSAQPFKVGSVTSSSNSFFGTVVKMEINGTVYDVMIATPPL